MLPWLERHNIPFVFTLYPGGGFFPYDTERDQVLKKIFHSPMFRKVIVTVNFTRDYLLEHKLCQSQHIAFILGGFSQLDHADIKPRLSYNTDKKTFDICFVAYKYTEKGVKKGFDIFIQVACQLSSSVIGSTSHPNSTRLSSR